MRGKHYSIDNGQFAMGNNQFGNVQLARPAKNQTFRIVTFWLLAIACCLLSIAYCQLAPVLDKQYQAAYKSDHCISKQYRITVKHNAQFGEVKEYGAAH
jgi:hypothetical protein